MYIQNTYIIIDIKEGIIVSKGKEIIKMINGFCRDLYEIQIKYKR